MTKTPVSYKTPLVVASTPEDTGSGDANAVTVMALLVKAATDAGFIVSTATIDAYEVTFFEAGWTNAATGEHPRWGAFIMGGALAVQAIPEGRGIDYMYLLPRPAYMIYPQHQYGEARVSANAAEGYLSLIILGLNNNNAYVVDAIACTTSERVPQQKTGGPFRYGVFGTYWAGYPGQDFVIPAAAGGLCQPAIASPLSFPMISEGVTATNLKPNAYAPFFPVTQEDPSGISFGLYGKVNNVMAVGYDSAVGTPKEGTIIQVGNGFACCAWGAAFACAATYTGVLV